MVLHSDSNVTEKIDKEELEEFFILSDLTIHQAKEASASVTKTSYKKCARCWRHRPTVGASKAHPDLCDRCESVVVQREKPGRRHELPIDAASLSHVMSSGVETSPMIQSHSIISSMDSRLALRSNDKTGDMKFSSFSRCRSTRSINGPNSWSCDGLARRGRGAL